MQNLKTEKEIVPELTETEEEKPIDWPAHFDLLLRNWKFIAYFTLAVTVISIIVSLLLPKSYLASATILPSKESAGGLSRLGQLSGIVGGLGLDAMLGGDNPSVTYPKILQSKTILYDLAREEFFSNRFEKRIPLYQILKIKGDSLPEILEKSEKVLREEVVSVNSDRKTDILTVSVITSEPQLAADIANSLIEKLNKFNIETRTKKAKENRIFIEKRLEEAKKDLSEAENELRRFREQNRKVESPDLLLQQGRLIREVKIQEEIFLTLDKEYELAKVSEVKDTPVISVLDKGIAPVKKEKPKRGNIVILTFFLSFCIAVSLVFIRNFYYKNHQIWYQETQYETIRKLLLRLNQSLIHIKLTSNKIRN